MVPPPLFEASLVRGVFRLGFRTGGGRVIQFLIGEFQYSDVDQSHGMSSVRRDDSGASRIAAPFARGMRLPAVVSGAIIQSVRDQGPFSAAM